MVSTPGHNFLLLPWPATIKYPEPGLPVQNYCDYRDNGMIFRILDLLSNSHSFSVAVINGRAFELAHPDRHYHEHFIDNCL